jgi:hypothetical protein
MDPFDLLRTIWVIGTVAPMARRETPVTVIPGHALDHELELMMASVDRARRNRWYEGDVTQSAFEPVLAAVTNRAPLGYTAGLGLTADRGMRPNRWQEDRTVLPGGPTRS